MEKRIASVAVGTQRSKHCQNRLR